MVSDQSQNSGLSTRLPNYVNPTTRGPAVQVTSILFAVLVSMSLALRLYTRGRIKRQFQVDDIFATFATVRAGFKDHFILLAGLTLANWKLIMADG